MLIRHETPADHEQVRAVNEAAFPGGGEAGLVDAVRAESWVSLVAEAERVVGHLLITAADLPDGSQVGAIGPMAVDAGHRRRGIGSLLVEASLESLRGRGAGGVVVLGHPEYYPRFGFGPAVPLVFEDESFAPAFFKMELAPGFLEGRSGPVRYHPAFQAL